jgi:cathepsin H
VNHAVVATGYGYENGLPFWNVKNSWGETWGNKGYFKILRGNNTCAIAQCNSYPLIDRPNNDNLRSY